MKKEMIVKGIVSVLENEVLGKENLSGPVVASSVLDEDLGMDSLDVLDLAQRLEKRFCVNLADVEVSNKWTVEMMADAVKKAMDERVERVESGESRE